MTSPLARRRGCEAWPTSLLGIRNHEARSRRRSRRRGEREQDGSGGAPVSFVARETADGERCVVVSDDLEKLIKVEPS